MIVGIPKEIKNGECRVGLTPEAVGCLRAHSPAVYVQKGAGILAGFADSDYESSGAKILSSARELWRKSDLVVKVKEPQKEEYKFLSRDKILLCYLHLAAGRILTNALLKSGITAIACETVRDSRGKLPLLLPMSEVAGKMSAMVAAYFLSSAQGGRGVIASGLSRVPPAHFVILGGGVVGENSAKIALGMGARVTILDKNEERLKSLKETYPRIATLPANHENIIAVIASADVIVGSVLVPGARAPRLLTKKMMSAIPRGAVLVDVCIDQGGVAETSRPTSHSQPTYLKEGILHYCVPNMPGAFGRSSSLAYSAAVLPYVLKLADAGLEKAFAADPGFASGLNVHAGKICLKELARP